MICVWKDQKLQHEMMTIVAQDCALEDKMLTVCYSCDMVNVSFVNFAAIGRNVVKVGCMSLVNFDAIGQCC